MKKAHPFIVFLVVLLGYSPLALAQPPLTIFSTDFDSGVPPQFSGKGHAVHVQGFGGERGFDGFFLRNSSLGGAESACVLTLENLPAHNSIDLNFLLAVIDSWDGNRIQRVDEFVVRIDGREILVTSFFNLEPRPNVGGSVYDVGAFEGEIVPPPGKQLGFNFGYMDTAYDMGQDPVFTNIPHSKSSIVVEWFGRGGGYEGGRNESFAIDNVEVILKNNVTLDSDN